VALDLLARGELDVVGRLVEASNATLFCGVTLDGVTAACVYKPVAGERPLWDFPDGTLAAREAATWEVSDATPWDLVPPTVLRNGPYGPGACQLWVEVDEAVDVVALSRSRHPDLPHMVVLDAVVNNADRKGGHLLPRPDGRVQGVDHGVTFSIEDKLRTVLWQWRGRPLPPEAIEVLHRLEADLEPGGVLRGRLAGLLTEGEVRALVARVTRLLAAQRYPHPSDEWPALPWPPF
jgi:uncharacterized repeat protein (TIGR03843 family)